ncbi:bifunctional non-homologous end joining protein LigD [Lentzea fradiae]|uniref:Bifunctional non-homologous end joining protein LigD n=1 Tax=Lentzea fradiae TaxID=200378 RepID=A0A1G7W9Q7_9PSEU|nr:non-homologous end-joining DNA ligase [Lentzea fradiae]SDG67810.1 bifunctional non-homologous end joining protein LigD [Lentzea fradiae]
MSGDGPNEVSVRVEDRVVKLTNLEKEMYPEFGFTKGEVIDYYTRIAPVLLPHLKDRPVTLKRFPNGVDGKWFFEKNAAEHRPGWVRTMRLESPGSVKGNETVNYVMVDELATLVWLANLAALELHVPQWTVGPRGGKRDPDLLVFDLDPGAPASLVECCRVAELVRTVLDDDGVDAWAKTSGNKGLQVYAYAPAKDTSEYAKGVARRLAKEVPELVVSTMAKAQRPGKVLIDWSQNNPAKTTVAPYSLRARERPTVSAPVTWDEVEECQVVEDLVFTAGEVLERVSAAGDLFGS